MHNANLIEKIMNNDELKHLFFNDPNTLYYCSKDVNSSGFTHLHKCVMNTKKNPFLNNYIDEYLSLNPKEIDITNKVGWSALMLAVANFKTKSSRETVEILLKHNTNVNIQDIDGWTPLMLACRYSKNITVIIEMLLKYGADINVQDKYGWTALMMACRHSKTTSSNKTVELLLKNHANVDLQNNDKWTALMLASRYSKEKSTEKTVKLLLKYHANPNIQEDDGWTALMLASTNSRFESSEETVKILLKYKADPNIQEVDGWTALMVATKSSNVTSTEGTVKILIENGANINQQKLNGYSALMLAVVDSSTESSINTVKILLEGEADVNLIENDGYDALCIAARNSNSTETVQLLLEYGSNPNFIYKGQKIIKLLYNNYLDNEIDVNILGLLISFGAKLTDLPNDKNLKKILKEKGYLKSNTQNIINYLNRSDIKLYKSTCQICFEDNVGISECKKEHKICFNCLNKLSYFKCEFCYPRV